ncbi:glycosyltransferase family 2 protein [Dysgonomonas sp. BGC7]|uniref:glycosyltransferase family 2 protein n=1 Tax=Dysgonomonas sp. BGC7 TaxID=1658008 RepID=UPI000681A25D|nr:glycosyltransferase family 2 protein [Dysgonomonas sp. BGC7]MBD8390043.1 glycosyltransferase [Dysgonomonas sp. BGC7]
MTLSIITVNYNNASGLEKTIISVLNQTYKDYEFIIIDGGSTDGGKEVIESYTDKVNYWVSEPDKGIYNAMNKGIVQAKGDYCIFMNSGDIFASDDVLHKIFHNQSYNTPQIRGNQITNFKTHTERWVNFGNRDVTLYDLYTSSFHHQATFIKRDLFIKYGSYNEDYKIVSDWEFSLRALLGGEKSTYIDVDVVIYEYGGTSSSLENKGVKENERNSILNKLLPKYILSDYIDLYNIKKERQSFYGYYVMTDFISKHKSVHFLFRIISKIYRTLNITN